jgi:hypothetical protein
MIHFEKMSMCMDKALCIIMDLHNFCELHSINELIIGDIKDWNHSLINLTKRHLTIIVNSLTNITLTIINSLVSVVCCVELLQTLIHIPLWTIRSSKKLNLSSKCKFDFRHNITTYKFTRCMQWQLRCLPTSSWENFVKGFRRQSMTFGLDELKLQNLIH